MLTADNQTSLFSPTVNRKLAEQGAEAAAGRADRATAGVWSSCAWDYFVDYARRSGGTFMAEDVRMASEKSQKVPTPPDGRAWGAIFLRAAKAHLIQRVGYAPNKDRTCHGSPKAVWRWVGS